MPVRVSREHITTSRADLVVNPTGTDVPLETSWVQRGGVITLFNSTVSKQTTCILGRAGSHRSNTYQSSVDQSLRALYEYVMQLPDVPSIALPVLDYTSWKTNAASFILEVDRVFARYPGTVTVHLQG